ncbi:high affinity methionine permease [Lentinula raphanica]|uniref:High affinity methionine permease n=1 Tax=Lentinula raphanica TaxID=153919 RepID=A0AA38PLJ6_9AGAR|nr:high affinity methionine permease [Lentinula raphanica]KAJ3822582.1 high affinity methionine permease [Lentinula raphanica]KAJ3845168.1 high affinity methionine permease [Lentinula raphanica]
MTDTPSKQSVYSEETIEQSFDDDEASNVPSEEDTGVPTETVSPLGYHVDWTSVIFLNVSRTIGIGVFTTPGTILKGVGSVGLSLIYWVVGFLFSAASLSVYLEYLSYYPKRSGADIAYLEKAYPRPRLFVPALYAFTFVFLSVSSSSAIVFAEYVLAALGTEKTTWNVRGLAVGMCTFVTLVCMANTKWSLRLSNWIGMIKVATLVFIALLGLIVLAGGIERVENPGSNFRNAFSGTSTNINGLANALLKIRFAYVGYENAFSVANEVRNPVPTLKKYAPLSLGIVFVLYFMANIAYFATVPKELIKDSHELTASLFFEAIFPNREAVVALQVLVALSSLGSVFASTISASRVVRECGRQGLLPYPRLWASTKPFGTPLAPYALRWFISCVIIILPPPGDAFNFIVDLQYYPTAVWALLLTIGLYRIRERRRKAHAPPSAFRVWDTVAAFALAVNVGIMVLPWVPPEGGIYGGDVSFFYATYCIVGVAIILLAALLYWIWFTYLPRRGQYRIRQVVEKLSDGAQALRTVKVPLHALAEWDATHDEHGQPILNTPTSTQDYHD